MQAGNHIAAKHIYKLKQENAIYPCFGGNGLRGYVEKPTHNGKDILIGRQGALCGNVQRVTGEFYATEHAVVVEKKEAVNIDWAYHMLTVMNLNQHASKSAQPGLSVNIIKKLRIPVPPLAEQARIVAILDKFDTLTSSISEGLPREIELRQQQYEYYRDRLFDFPKPETVKEA